MDENEAARVLPDLERSHAGCYSCQATASLDELPASESILVEAGWRVAHAFNTALGAPETA